MIAGDRSFPGSGVNENWGRYKAHGFRRRLWWYSAKAVAKFYLSFYFLETSAVAEVRWFYPNCLFLIELVQKFKRFARSTTGNRFVFGSTLNDGRVDNLDGTVLYACPGVDLFVCVPKFLLGFNGLEGVLTAGLKTLELVNVDITCERDTTHVWFNSSTPYVRLAPFHLPQTVCGVHPSIINSTFQVWAHLLTPATSYYIVTTTPSFSSTFLRVFTGSISSSSHIDVHWVLPSFHLFRGWKAYINNVLIIGSNHRIKTQLRNHKKLSSHICWDFLLWLMSFLLLFVRFLFGNFLLHLEASSVVEILPHHQSTEVWRSPSRWVLWQFSHLRNHGSAGTKLLPHFLHFFASESAWTVFKLTVKPSGFCLRLIPPGLLKLRLKMIMSFRKLINMN